jgi:hypothetical protein
MIGIDPSSCWKIIGRNQVLSYGEMGAVPEVMPPPPPPIASSGGSHVGNHPQHPIGEDLVLLAKVLTYG